MSVGILDLAMLELVPSVRSKQLTKEMMQWYKDPVERAESEEMVDEIQEVLDAGELARHEIPSEPDEGDGLANPPDRDVEAVRAAALASGAAA